MHTLNSHLPSYNRVLLGSSSAGASIVPSVSPPKNKNIENAIASTSSEATDTNLSTLARQLSDAATRAGKQSTDPLKAVTGDKFLANKAQQDAERPATDNPELLARARQATRFVSGTDTNPFKGLASDQLSLIARDEGGPFTVNERRAAWEELQSVEAQVAANPKPTAVSGREIMISRLFGNSEPPVAVVPATSQNITQNRHEFLNADDRALISDMYTYAHAQGADLYYVDALAMSLSTYRYYSDGRDLRGGNDGYDLQGYRVTFDFKQEDAAIASRILSGPAINSTRIDQGFLRHILNPDYGAFSNVGGIPFLERMVNKFSNLEADQLPLGSEFATFKKIKIEDHIVRTTHKHIKLAPSKPLTELVNGVWTLTEEGKTAGYKLDKTTGLLIKPAVPPDARSTLSDMIRKAPKPYLLDALSGTDEPFTTRRIWPGHLFKLMKNYKP